ncbi:outer membrane protein assembly factor BamD [Ectothiorhodospira magna]|uniref:Outer membrane protein assembly factor BamD n=1 Tax=Ectothiorhodospira magna TaxID=867345 RepID=A0A1H9DNK6_9GAMM|nr:outer membrane protein assembly factor BamD [Ectothiorhodospira magna]SEQ15065.1 outer membrane protein assembly factor BamD [Ectothiorhodospira magna]
MQPAPSFFHRWIFFCLLALVVWLAGCTTVPTSPVPGDSAALNQALTDQDCKAAVAVLETWPPPVPADARLETAFLCLISDQPLLAFEHSGHFIRAFPTHPDLDYGFYLRAMARYGSWKALQEGTLVPPDQDRALAREAFILFRELVQRFPDSRYRDEVAGYLMDLREGLAAVEVRQARTLLAQGDARQALARAEYVREHFGTTQTLADALAVMVDAHQALGHDEAAARARHWLEVRFPDRAGQQSP